jgi:23S rRNA (guanosine2251-2'-O)-methyltransferase
MEDSFLEGAVAVIAALAAESREVRAVYLRQDKYDSDAAAVERLAKACNVPVSRVTAAQLDALAARSSHGGVVAPAGPRRLVGLGELLPGDRAPFVAMLDGVEDPYNFGQAIRALYAAGASGLVLRPRNWLSAAAVVARSSAGASERLPMAVAETPQAAATFFREAGLAIAAAAREQAIPLTAADLTVPLFLVVGGEKRGITRSFRGQIDLLLAIPYGRPFDQSLGTAAATAVLAFEVMRQRRSKGDNGSATGR